MLRPERMRRVLVVGPRDSLEAAIEKLHALQAVHLLDYHETDEGFELGKPLARASELSENLVKLRSMASTLKVAADPEVSPEAPADLRARILALEVNLQEEDGSRKNMEALVSDLDRKIEERRPFAALPLPFESYQPYDNVAVVVGRYEKDLTGLEAVAPQHEAFQVPGAVAVFMPAAKEQEARDFLGRRGFTPLEVPEASGVPKAVISRLEADREKWRARLAEIETRLTTLREKYAQFLLKAEAALEVEVEKAEAPLRFATTEHSFVIEGWLAETRAVAVEKALTGVRGIHVETEAPSHGGHGGDPPVLMKNRGIAKRFEFLIKLFSTPGYHEVDPTFFVSLVFPVFFGLMIGDAGYGALWAVLGGLGYAKMKPGAFRNLMFVMFLGGLMAFILGMFVWGEAFGIPFHLKIPSEIVALKAVDPAAAGIAYAKWLPEAGKELTWACGDLGVSNDCLGLSVPVYPMMNKLQTDDVLTMIVLSVTAALIHLGIGFSVGLVNEWSHSKKHAVAKAAWILALVGLFILIIGRVVGSPDPANGNLGCLPAAEQGRSHCQVAFWLQDNVLFWAGLQNQFLLPVLGLPLPISAIVFLGIAAVLIAVTEGGVAIMEIAGLLASIVSYARLAGIGVAKAATASAFNGILFAMILSGDTLNLILGFVFLVLAQMLVFMLGAVSAGIQALRLNYVEFFVKFFKGNGTSFQPFGAKAAKEA